MRVVLPLFMVTIFLLYPGYCPADTSSMPYDIVEASRRGDDHAVRKLLENNPALATEKDGLGYTPLDWAAVRGYWVILRHLLDADAPVNNIAGDGGTPLHRVCHHDRPDIVGLLLAKGADIDISNRWGRVPLHVSARRGGNATAKLLLNAGADPNATTKEGWTPLHVAYMAGQPELVKVLIEGGADPERKDLEGKRPEDYAFTRPVPVTLTQEQIEEYVGHYDLGRGFSFKIWRESDGLHIREFAPDGLYPIGEDEFFCEREPWRVNFLRDESGKINAVDVAFLRRTVRGQRRDHAHYVGSQSCKACHLGDENAEYMRWITSRHAAAYWRLETDWAKLLVTFRPAYKDITEPVREERCLLCHTTAAQDPDAIFSNSYRVEEGVGCEMCHGPGSRYSDPAIMADRAQFLAHGGIVPDEKTCQKCHRNAERFSFEEWWPKIEH